MDFSSLHFLRPLWLLALIPAVALCIALWRRKSSGANWRRAIAPELLKHLLDQRGERRQRWPFLALLLGWVIASFALAGPTWEKLPQPVLQQRDALVIVLDLSLSMYAEDVKPSRLQRARYKVLDILNRRHEGFTALVAYSGDAHVVAPLTDDTATIANLVPALAPDMMPQYGSDPVAGIRQAVTLLHNAGFQRGRILLISDEITEGNIDAIAKVIDAGHWQFSMLGVGTEQGAPIPLPPSAEDNQSGGFLKQQNGTIVVARLNRERFEQLARRTSGRYSDLRLDDGDLDALLPKVLPSADETRAVERDFDQWRERGAQLAMLLLPLAALAFRRGWLLALLLLPLSPPSQALEWRDLWQRPDQQGAAQMQAGDPKAAAEKFQDPNWRGSALYRAGDYAGAARNFPQDSAESNYNRGNALAHTGKLEDAIQSYDEALKQNPDLEDAKANRDLLKKLLEQQQKNPQQSGQNSKNGSNQQQQQGQNQQNQAQGGSNQQQPGERGNNADNQDGQNNQNGENQPQQQQNKTQDGQRPGEQPQGQPQQGQQGAPEQAKQDQAQQEGRQPGQAEQQKQQQAQGEQQAAAPGENNDTQQREQNNATDQWLRQIPDDPSGLLRRKFNYEHRQRAQDGAQRDDQQPLW